MFKGRRIQTPIHDRWFFSPSLFILLFAIFWHPVLIFSQETSDYQKKLTELAREIAELKEKIKKEEGKKSTLLSEMDKIGFKKKLLQSEISVLNTRMGQANLELSKIESQIPGLKKELDKENKAITLTLQTIYKYGRPDFLELLFKADDLNQVIGSSKQLHLLVQHQENLITRYLNTLQELQQKEKALEEKKQEIVKLIEQTGMKKKELEAQEKERRQLIQRIERNKKTFLQTLEELNAQAEQLRLLIEKLQKKEIELPYHLIPLYEKKGKLPWPISGKVISRFGLQRHPRFNTVTMNNGIEVSVPENSVINAIHDGSVVYKDYFQGYGNLIILDHGLTYYSLYGHCSEFLVKKGAFVRTGQPIALTGESGSMVGPAMYFELRFKTKPLDPLQWLEKR
ncbi:MAG: murein hydrolase activator EnvC family protein [Acidobacteriota bacterium]